MTSPCTSTWLVNTSPVQILFHHSLTIFLYNGWCSIMCCYHSTLFTDMTFVALHERYLFHKGCRHLELFYRTLNHWICICCCLCLKNSDFSVSNQGRQGRVEGSDRWTDHKRHCTCIWKLFCTLIRGWRPIHPVRQMLSSTGDKGVRRWQASSAAGEGLGWSSAGRVKTGVGEVLGCQINGWTHGGIKVHAYWLLKIKIQIRDKAKRIIW